VTSPIRGTDGAGGAIIAGGEEAMTEPERKTNRRAGGDGRAVHDLGGLLGGPIDRAEHATSLHEKRVDALVSLLVDPKRPVFRLDALRRTIEDLDESEYDGLSYYDRWARAARNLLVEKEILTADEIEAKMAEIRGRLEDAGVTVARPET
jgi:hypothetical protein